MFLFYILATVYGFTFLSAVILYVYCHVKGIELFADYDDEYEDELRVRYKPIDIDTLKAGYKDYVDLRQMKR